MKQRKVEDWAGEAHGRMCNQGHESDKDSTVRQDGGDSGAVGVRGSVEGVGALGARRRWRRDS